MVKLSKLSLKRLKTCDSRLQLICLEASKYIEFYVVCGHRGMIKQNIAYKKGFSNLKYPKSKHNKKPSLAMDLIPYKTQYKNTNEFYYLAGIIMATAKRFGFKIKWGGRWKKRYDLPHYELIERLK